MKLNRKFFILGLLIFFTSCLPVDKTPTPTASMLSAQVTPIVVRILNLDVALEPPPTDAPLVIPPTPTSVLLPSPYPISTLTIAQPQITLQATPSCTNQAEFLRHLTISDNTVLDAGQVFAKIWQIRNSGTCTWTSDYGLNFYSGEQMNSPARVNIPKLVPAGGIVEIRVPLTAPVSPSTFSAHWVMSDADGNIFGFGKDGNETISVVIKIKPPARPTPG